MKKIKKVKRIIISKIKIPKKIHEIISYLSHTFGSKVLDQEDNKQDLYVRYVETIKKHPETFKHKPGWWFLRFKWFLTTKYSKTVRRINKEWEFALKNDPERSEKQSRIGHIPDPDDPGETEE